MRIGAIWLEPGINHANTMKSMVYEANTGDDDGDDPAMGRSVGRTYICVQ